MTNEKHNVSRRGFLKAAAAGIGVGAAADLSILSSMAGAASMVIVTENLLPGAPDTEWYWDSHDLGTSIEGFATPYSVNAGETVNFKVKTTSNNWRVRIYRMGWYGGLGARRVATINAPAGAGNQPAPYKDTTVGLVDCGNWATSLSWAVPASAVSGVYLANFERLDNGEVNRTWFVVRNDSRATDVLVQTSDTTWQAYNNWGGASLYEQTNNTSPTFNRAVKVSYDRPLSAPGPEHSFMWTEYPLVRWLERNGYDVAYCAGVDTDRRPTQLLNRRVFVSSGHDEYWSGQQRANVEAAQAAGVHLIFMSGNEVFWKTRWEASPLPGASPYKTLVCYKETLANAKIDPSPTWTGTWRDARFTPPSDGGRPENALTGTLFQVINPTWQADFAIEVTDTMGKLRMWRNTSVATLGAGQRATLANSTLGYEWDVDADNGFRPGGLIRLSDTTRLGDSVLQDAGGTYASKVQTTHAITMYRAPSGALVWGLGTVQWAWGLDEQHDYNPENPISQDVRMQQATLNVLADMGAQPSSRQLNLAAASASSDTAPPVVTISSPAPGTSILVGNQVTISGTATDSAGKVAGVEFSTDGATWHPATGTTSWSFPFMARASGAQPIRVRATDDSCNTSAPVTVTLNGTPRPYPCSIWPGTTVPGKADSGDNTPIEVGVKFQTTVDGFVSGIRFYKNTGNSGTHVGHLWTSGGALLATATFSGETASGWQQASFASPVPVVAGTTYVASTYMPKGRYAVDSRYFSTSGWALEPLKALRDGESGANGLFRYGTGGGFPADSYQGSNYWVDVVFHNDNFVAPTMADRSPAPGVQAVAATSPVTARFSEFMDPQQLAITVKDPSGTPVPGTTIWDRTTLTATFTPSQPMALATTHVVTVTAKDLAGNAMAPATWSFMTTAAEGDYPATLWDSSATPVTAAVVDNNAVEVGVRFTADSGAVVSALRFYKGSGNGGTHIGHLWGPTGALLGSVTFTNETASGWQQAAFATPVPIVAGTRYTASYHCDNGGYSRTSGGLTAGRNRGPLHALPSTPQLGNGVFRYGATAVPTESYNDSNYWVDVVILDTSAPSIADRAPAPGVNAVSTTSPVTATFSEAVAPGTVVFTLTGPGGAVAGAVSYDGPTRTARFTPSAPLAAAASYTASVTAKDLAGNTLSPSPSVWSFTTAAVEWSYPTTLWDSSAVPAIASSSDTGALDVGVRFRSDVDGLVSALRFYKGPNNAGTHVGHLWGPAGQLLGTATFSAETATGWQQASFPSPVAIARDLIYTASYHCDAGGYSTTAGGLDPGRNFGPLHAVPAASGGNGVFHYGPAARPTESFNGTNYWVDIVMTAQPDSTAPTVVDRSPAVGVNAVATTSTVTATFSEAMHPTMTSLALSGPGGAVAGTSSYDPATKTMTFTPGSALASGATYTATVSGRDISGNALATVQWSFTTAAPAGSYPATLWDSSATPALPSSSDGNAIEVGVLFTTDVDGVVTGLRFYKGPGNTGTHLGRLWSAAGALLAEVTFTGESGGGWQQATLASPVPVTAGTTYVASYFAPNGNYAKNAAYFTTPRDAGTLHAPAGANGVFRYGGGFPADTYDSTNYWVDVVFNA